MKQSNGCLTCLQIILLVGTKLQVIITKMGLRIQERGQVVKGTPVVKPGDDLFWFKRPRILLYLIHFVLFQVSLPKLNRLISWMVILAWKIMLTHLVLTFLWSSQNAFQLAFFAWTWVSHRANFLLFMAQPSAYCSVFFIFHFSTSSAWDHASMRSWKMWLSGYRWGIHLLT